jgi:glycerophosphoryl diester phosphodiesterase
MEAYEGALTAGCQAIEQDVQTLNDGTSLGCMHDATVDRTTTATGNVSDRSAGSWQQLAVDAGTWLTGGWGTTLKAPLFDQVVGSIGGQAVCFPESKDGASAAKIARKVIAAGLQDSFVITSFTFADVAAAAALGVSTMYVDTTGATQTPAAIVAAGIGWVAVDYTATSAPTVAALKAAGLKVIAYTIERRSHVAAAVALGITDGYYSDDPIYTDGSNTHRRLTDPFKSQTWYHGHLGTTSVLANRGQFTAPKYWGYTDSTSAFYIGAVQGWGCPIQNAAGSYTITWSMALDALAGGDTSRWGALWFAAADDRAYTNAGASTENGYLVLIRATGTIDLYSVVNGAATVIASKSTGVTALTLGTPATFRVTVTPTTVKAERTDIAYTTPTATNSAHRGAYFHLGRNGASARFSDVTIA